MKANISANFQWWSTVMSRPSFTIRLRNCTASGEFSMIRPAISSAAASSAACSSFVTDQHLRTWVSGPRQPEHVLGDHLAEDLDRPAVGGGALGEPVRELDVPGRLGARA